MASDLVLLTGGTGHIGFHVLLDTLRKGYRVRAAVRSESTDRVQKIKASPHLAALNLASDTLTFVTVPDFLAPNAFDDAVKGVKYILHVASPIADSRVPGGDDDANFIQPAKRGTIAVLEAAAKSSSVEKIVVTSSVVATVPPSAFASGTERTHTAADRVNFVPGPYEVSIIAYCFSKIAALNAAEEWYRDHNPKFDLIHIHPSMVFGPDLLVDDADYMRKNGTNAWVLDSATGNPDSRSNGSVHVTDVSKTHVAALSPEIKGLQSFGTTSKSDWSQLGAIVQRFYPEAVKKGILKVDAGLTNTPFDYDASATEKQFGFKFKTFEEQAKDAVGYYLKLLGEA